MVERKRFYPCRAVLLGHNRVTCFLLVPPKPVQVRGVGYPRIRTRPTPWAMVSPHLDILHRRRLV